MRTNVIWQIYTRGQMAQRPRYSNSRLALLIVDYTVTRGALLHERWRGPPAGGAQPSLDESHALLLVR